MTIDNYLFGSTVIVLFVSCSALGIVLIRKFKAWKNLTSHHEVMGYLFPVAGSIYGVLLGLVVVNAITVFENARETVNTESSDLVSIYMLAGTQAPEIRHKLRSLCRSYAATILEYEWESMDRGAHHQKAHTYVLQLFNEIITLEKNPSDSVSKMVDVGISLWKTRRERINTAMKSIPLVEWITLCSGAILVVFFSYMFVMDSMVIQLIGTVMLSTLIALNLYLVVLFGHPFSGDLKVSNYPFQHAMLIFDEIDASSDK